MAARAQEEFVPGRVSGAYVDPLFLRRWSRRAFSPRAVEPEIVESLFEAARWAPSARNAQPWVFVVAASEEELARSRPILNEKNRLWAAKAPLLAFLFARRHHGDGKPNRSAAFDAGAAWMSLALQAARLGLVTHAMGGFAAPLAYEVLGVPEAELEAQVAIAIGYPGDPSALPPELAGREGPSTRFTTDQFVHRGRYVPPV